MTIKSTDQTEAADEIQYLIDSKAGLVSAYTQKVLTDDTSAQSSEAGDPVDLALTTDEQSQFLTDCDASLTAILAARTAAAPATDTGTESTDADTSADAATGTAPEAETDSSDTDATDSSDTDSDTEAKS